MPGTDTGDLTQTLVRLAGQLCDPPAGDNALVTLTLRDRNGVDHLVLLKDRVDGDRLLEKILAEVELANLGVAKHTHDGAVLLDARELLVDAGPLGILFGVTRESLLRLRGTPVLVEAALALVAEMLRPHGAEGLEAPRSLNIADEPAHDHRRTLDDGDGLDDLLFVSLGASLID